MAVDEVAALKALAEASRLRVAQLLAERGEVCACDLLDELSITQPTLSHHMRVLQDAGLVTCRKQGKWCHYSLVPEALGRLAMLFNVLAEGAAVPAEGRGGCCRA